MENLTLSDTLRNWISQKFDESYDFSLQSSRKLDLDNFISTYKERGWKAKSVRPSYSRILDETMKNRGIDPKTIGKQTKRPKLGGSANIQATITPKPVAGQVETPSQSPQVDNTQQNNQGAAPQVGAPPAGLPPVNPYAQSFDSDGVGATFSALTTMIRMAYPEMEMLSEIEKNSLGKMWLPFFQKYMTENMAVVGVPLLATFGMLIPKITKARKLHNENQAKKDKEEKTKKEKEEKKDGFD